MIDYSILSPTALQASREVDGSYTVSVSIESHAPAYGYINYGHYAAAEMAGAITIHQTDPMPNGFIEINYSVN